MRCRFCGDSVVSAMLVWSRDLSLLHNLEHRCASAPTDFMDRDMRNWPGEDVHMCEDCGVDARAHLQERQACRATDATELS